MNDPVKNPSHYQFEYNCAEVRDVIRDRITRLSKSDEYYARVGDLAYDYSNAIKYLLRAFLKGKPIEDLNKAKYCIDTLLSQLENRTDEKKMWAGEVIEISNEDLISNEDRLMLARSKTPSAHFKR
jgi:hypothetical protein